MSRQPEASHDDLVREREALEELIGTEGWKYFVAHVRREWQGSGYHSRLTTAFNNSNDDARVLHRASQEIIRLFAWPASRITDLKGQAK